MSAEPAPVVMVVEDDPTVRGVVHDYLGSTGFEVRAHADGRSALAALRASLPDVLILDRMLPGLSGDELCGAARSIAPALPILMLTALDTIDDRIDGLEHGADDYVSKPFALRELQLRVEAMLRRRQAPGAIAPLRAGPFRVDPARRRIHSGRHEIALTTREYELLLFLLQNPDRVIGRDEILREVWGWGAGDASTVTVHVRRLREKIEPDPRSPRYLLTEWGAGYRFATETSAGC